MNALFGRSRSFFLLDCSDYGSAAFVLNLPRDALSSVLLLNLFPILLLVSSYSILCCYC